MPKEHHEKIGERLGACGWKTGSVLTAEHASSVAASLQRAGRAACQLKAGDRVIVVSQTCDVVVSRLDPEPFVEVLIAKECKAIERNKANLRSTRHLSFRATINGAVLDAHAADRYWIPRELFDNHSPDIERSLDAPASKKLCEWLGLRYTRPAWPNALVRRLPPKEKIEKILREVSLAVAEIRVGISDNEKELPDDAPYKLVIYAVMDAEEYNSSPDQRERCTKTFVEFLQLLRKCLGIEVIEDSDVVPGDEFTWQMMQMTDRWNLANLTSDAEQS